MLAGAPASDGERVASAYRDILGRAPSAGEEERALLFLAEARELVAGSLGAGSAEPPAGAPIEAAAGAEVDPDLRALSGLCQVLLSSNEFLYVD